jgi:hypothetical protein
MMPRLKLTSPIFFLMVTTIVLSTSELSAQPFSYNWRSLQTGGFGAIPDIQCVVPPGGTAKYFLATDVGSISRCVNPSPATPTWEMLLKFMNRVTDDDNYGTHLGVSRDGQTIYVAAGKLARTGNPTDPKGKVWKSTDGGSTWSEPAPGFRIWTAAAWDTFRGTNRVTVDPNNANVVYYASREGLYWSYNGGVNWQPIAAAPDGLYQPNADSSPSGCGWVIVDGRTTTNSLVNGTPVFRSQRVYCCALGGPQSGVYRNTQGGIGAWNLLPGPGGVRLEGWHADLDVNSGNLWMTVGTGARKGLYRCRATENTFSEISSFNNNNSLVLPDTAAFLSGISIHRTRPNSIAVARRWTFAEEPGRGENDVHNAVIASSDGGVTWRIITQAVINNNVEADSKIASDFGVFQGPIRDVQFDHSDPSGNTLFFAGWLPYRTRNWNAATINDVRWRIFTKGHEELVDLGGGVSPSAGLTRFWSTFGDVAGFRHRSIDSWPTNVKEYGPRPAAEFTGVDASPTNPNVVVMVGRQESQGPAIGFYSDNADTANPVFDSMNAAGMKARIGANAAGGKIAISANSSTLVWAAQNADGVAYSGDKGQSWFKASGIPGLIDGGSIFNDESCPIAADRGNANFFYATRNGTAFYRSSNAGRAFTSFDSFPGIGVVRPTVRAVRDRSNKSWVGVALDERGLYLCKDATVAGAPVFTKVPNVGRAYGFDFGTVPASSPSGNPSMYLFGTYNGSLGIWRSDNGGQSFARINLQAPNGRQIVYANDPVIVGDRQVEGGVYVCTIGTGIFYGEPN